MDGRNATEICFRNVGTNVRSVSLFFIVNSILFKEYFFFFRNELRKVPSLVQSYITKRQYLHATKTLIQSLDVATGSLSSVEGLNDLRNELELRMNQLYLKLVKELNRHLYQISTNEILSNFHRQGSARTSNLSSPFQRNNMRRSVERAEANSKMRKILFEMSQTGFDLEKTDFIQDTDLLDSDSSFFIIVECFSLMQKCPDSLEVFFFFFFQIYIILHKLISFRQLKCKCNPNYLNWLQKQHSTFLTFVQHCRYLNWLLCRIHFWNC